jgi:hypothetical protein
MKNKFMIATVMFALSSALTVPAVWADESGAKEKKEFSKTTLKRYDKDKDGTLNAEEEAKWVADKEKAKMKRAEKKKAKEGAATSEADTEADSEAEAEE